MKLKQFKINSGGRFNPDTTGPVVIDFSKSKMVGATGDQEVGKSTLLDLFLMACGQNGGDKVVEILKNRKTGDIDLEFSFVGKDKANYDVKVKNGNITIKREGETLRSGNVGLLKAQLGIVGVSPMDIKNADIDKIVKWLAQYSTRSAEDFEKEMAKYKDGIKKAKKVRADANKSVKGCREYLSGEGYVDSKGEIIESVWKESEVKFKKKVDIADVSKRLAQAEKDADKYLRAEEKLKGHKDRQKTEQKRVEELEAQLKEAKQVLVQTEKDIATGEKYLVDNKADKTNYDTVKKEFENVSKDVVAYDKWQEVKKKKAEMDEFEDLAIKADNSEKDFVKKQQELQWEVIPDIKGVEIILEDTHEDEGEQKKAGFYYKGLNSAQLSNSEWFGLVMQILKKNKIEVLIVDDISQFGSKFMETLESLAKSGCYILYTEMSRGQQTLEIEYAEVK